MLFVLDVYDPVLACTALGVGSVSAAIFLAGSRMRDPTWFVLTAVALGCAQDSVFARWTTPFWIQPLVATGTGIAVLLYSPARHRPVRAVLCLTPVLAPYALEVLGVLSPTTFLEAGAVRLVPTLAEPLPIWFVAVHFVLVVVGGFASIRTVLEQTHVRELRARSQAWLLERVLEPR